jgi:hypothetical protein
MGAVFYPMLTAVCWYLGSQAALTQPVWSRYPAAIDGFMTCPACSGFWYGLGLSVLGGRLGWAFFTLPGRSWVTYGLVAFSSIFWTPVTAWLMTLGTSEAARLTSPAGNNHHPAVEKDGRA